MKSHNHTQSGRVSREMRQLGASLRQEESDGRTPTDRLAALDARLGAGVGANRERKALVK